MIPLGFESSETTKVYTFKFNPIYRVSLDLCKTGFIKEWLSDVNTQRKHSIRTLTESSRYLHKLYFHGLSGLCCIVAQESALLGYDATSLGNQFPAF